MYFEVLQNTSGCTSYIAYTSKYIFTIRTIRVERTYHTYTVQYRSKKSYYVASYMLLIMWDLYPLVKIKM